MATWYIGYEEPEWDIPVRHSLPYWTSKDDARLGWDTADAAYEYIYDNVEAGDTLTGPIALVSGYCAGPGSYIARRYE